MHTNHVDHVLPLPSGRIPLSSKRNSLHFFFFIFHLFLKLSLPVVEFSKLLIMAYGNDDKAAVDLELIEHGSGRGERTKSLPVAHADGRNQAGTLEVYVQHRFFHVICRTFASQLTRRLAVHQSRSCRQLWRHHPRFVGVVRRDFPVRPHKRRSCLDILRLYPRWVWSMCCWVFAGRVGFHVG